MPKTKKSRSLSPAELVDEARKSMPVQFAHEVAALTMQPRRIAGVWMRYPLAVAELIAATHLLPLASARVVLS